MTRRSLPFGVLAVAYLGVVGLITLGPTLWRTRPARDDYDVLSLATWLDPDTWVRIGSPEFVANILLFVPLGLLLRLALPGAGSLGAGVLRATLIGAAVSVAIEVLQVGTPRVSDPRDIIANGLGTLAGALLGSVIGLLASARRNATRVGVSASAVSPPAGRPEAG